MLQSFGDKSNHKPLPEYPELHTQVPFTQTPFPRRARTQTKFSEMEKSVPCAYCAREILKKIIKRRSELEILIAPEQGVEYGSCGAAQSVISRGQSLPC